MGRIYKTIRLAYETKYWIDQLILNRTDQLKNEIRNTELLEKIECQLFNMNTKELDGVSVNVILNVTVGSVIEQAVRYSEAKKMKNEDWHKISAEVELAKKKINDRTQDNSDATPRVYMNEQIYRKLEDLQRLLREDSARVPRMSFVIKLVVYNLYKEYTK